MRRIHSLLLLAVAATLCTAVRSALAQEGGYDIAAAQQEVPFTFTGLLAPSSVDGSAMPSGQQSFGFPQLGPIQYHGLTQSQSTSGMNGALLPPVSTGSFDGNSCDLPNIRPLGVDITQR